MNIEIFFPQSWAWDNIGNWLEARQADGFWLNYNPNPVWSLEL